MLRCRLLLLCCLALLAAPGPWTQETILIDFESPTRFIGNTSDPGLGTSWVDPVFDDSAWIDGQFGIGYQSGSGAENLIQTPIGPSHFSVYTRTTFDVADPTALSNLYFAADYDDGVVVWLNGIEIYRSPEVPAGAIDWNTSAQSREPSNAILPVFDPMLDISTALPLLVPGANVLAVGIWNDFPFSSDLVIVPRLVANLALDLIRRPYIQDARPTEVTIRWRTATLRNSRIIFGTSPTDLKTRRNFVFKTDHELTLSDLQPNALYYYAVGDTTELLVGGGETFTFVTPPPAGTRKPMRIWILGDVGTGQSAAKNNRDRYYRDWSDRRTDFWMLLGDNAYQSGTDQEYQDNFFDLFSEMLQRAPVWSALGNHDGFSSDASTQTGPYFDLFRFPTDGGAGGVASGTEAYYSFDYGNIHAIVLDSTGSDRSPGSGMLTWLEQDLATVTADWTIAFWHHPAYSKGSHDSDFELELVEMRENVVPILEDHGVDLVFAGHSHDYERTYLIDGHYDSSSTYSMVHELDGGDGSRTGDGAYTKPTIGPAPNQGAVYTVAGSAGHATGGTLNHPAMQISLNVTGTVVVDIDGLVLDVSFFGGNGAIMDQYRIVKGPVPSPPIAAFSAAPSTGPVPLAVSFTDLSSGVPNEWSWDFENDGNEDSIESAPVKIYDSPGVYSVRQFVGNVVGVDDQIEVQLICVTATAPTLIGDLRHGPDFIGFFWSAPPGSPTYDVVRGDLGSIPGGLAGTNPSCGASGLTATSFLDPEIPLPNTGFYYLNRATDCSGAAGSLDTAESSQVGSRDIALATTCPQ